MQADILGVLGRIGIAVPIQSIISRVMKLRRLMTGMRRIGEIGEVVTMPGTPRTAIAA